MKYIEVVADQGNADTIAAIADQMEAPDFRLGMVDEGGLQWMRLLVSDAMLQATLDALQNVLGTQAAARIIVLPVEISLPRPAEGETRKTKSATAAREALYHSVEKDAQLHLNFIILVVLSTVVAAIGLIENSVAIVIGAMVIAPLLGPNLAFALGTSLGDIALMRKAVGTIVVGIALAVGLSALISIAWPFEITSPELIARTVVGLDSVALALASGAAAALSLTTGLSSVLVGVMVAVALLPPAATVGLMLGHSEVGLAVNSALLLAINIVCVNLASKVVFLAKGISPRTWFEKTKARRAMTVYILVWLITLVILIAAVFARPALTTG